MKEFINKTRQYGPRYQFCLIKCAVYINNILPTLILKAYWFTVFSIVIAAFWYWFSCIVRVNKSKQFIDTMEVVSVFEILLSSIAFKIFVNVDAMMMAVFIGVSVLYNLYGISKKRLFVILLLAIDWLGLYIFSDFIKPIYVLNPILIEIWNCILFLMILGFILFAETKGNNHIINSISLYEEELRSIADANRVATHQLLLNMLEVDCTADEFEKCSLVKSILTAPAFKSKYPDFMDDEWCDCLEIAASLYYAQDKLNIPTFENVNRILNENSMLKTIICNVFTYANTNDESAVVPLEAQVIRLINDYFEIRKMSKEEIINNIQEQINLRYDKKLVIALIKYIQ